MIGTVTKAGHGLIIIVGYDADSADYVAHVITTKRTVVLKEGDLMVLRHKVDEMATPETQRLVVNAFRTFSQNARGQCRAVMQQTRLYIQASKEPRTGKSKKGTFGGKKVVKVAKKVAKKSARG